MTTQKRKETAKNTSSTRKNKVAAAKETAENVLEKALNLPCFAAFDCNSLDCFNCAGKKQCTLTQQDILCAKAVQADKVKNPRTKTVKVERKVGLIELFAQILLHEKSITLADLLQKSMTAGGGDYANMPIVTASQFCTHLEHLSKNKSIPISKAGYKVVKGDDNLYLADMGYSSGTICNMFGMI